MHAFAQRPYAAVTIEEIARTAGLAHRLLCATSTATRDSTPRPCGRSTRRCASHGNLEQAHCRPSNVASGSAHPLSSG
ncbi:hypothetical protein [Streptomyces canus]|uniref:hypothetical protein n=1 Tax=Streptomyces canus TaxID=58343 RepID=UPI003CE6D5C8